MLQNACLFATISFHTAENEVQQVVVVCFLKGKSDRVSFAVQGSPVFPPSHTGNHVAFKMPFPDWKLSFYLVIFTSE